jgi:hypothetical protein
MKFVSITYNLLGGDVLTHYVKANSSQTIHNILDIWKWSDDSKTTRFISNSNSIDEWCYYKLEDHINIESPYPKGRHIRNTSSSKAITRHKSTIEVSFLDDHEIDWCYFINKKGDVIGEDKTIPIEIHVNKVLVTSLIEYDKCRLLELLGLPTYRKMPFSYKKTLDIKLCNFLSLDNSVGELSIQWKSF